MILVIDGNNIYARIFFAFLAETEENPFYAVEGFVRYMARMIDDWAPSHMVIAWDSDAYRRRELYSDYKGHRPPKPAGFYDQLTGLKEVLTMHNVCQLKEVGYEADDIIYTICLIPWDEQVVVVTSDRDLLQVVDGDTTVELLRFNYSTRKTIRVRFNKPEAVFLEYGIWPSQFPDYKGLAGDASDNIPHPANIGHKTAVALLQQFATLDGVYKNLDQLNGSKKETRWVRLLEQGQHLALLGRELGTLMKVSMNFRLSQAGVPNIGSLIAEATNLTQLVR